MRLTAEFYQGSTLQIAKRLLGKRLVRRLPQGIVAGWIVEVEAYLSRGDEACHASRGMTPGNRAMFGPPGTLYVYPIHSRYCMNVVTDPEGCGAAVLVRAIEPTDGISLMQANRGLSQLEQLTNGPGKLCSAMDIDRRLNGVDLTIHPEIWLEDCDWTRRLRWRTTSSGRIGIRAAQEKPWRFFVDGNRYVSGRVRDHRSGRNQAFGPSKGVPSHGLE